MRIKAKIAFAGTEASLAPGAEADVSDEFGKAMIDAGYATEVKATKSEKPKAETKKTSTAKK